MRKFLIAAVGLGALGLCGSFAPASAQSVVIQAQPAVPYWQQRHEDSNWRARREFREREYQHEAWLRDHCVRDWSGGEYCRR